MRLKGIVFNDFINYKKPCMILETPFCDFKCDKECGQQVCQNGPLAKAPIFDYNNKSIIKIYNEDDLSQAIVFQGLEPLDNRFFQELLDFIDDFRINKDDDIVIYTGFKEEEIDSKISILKKHKNIIIKFGRFIPDQKSHFDEVLGVNLASPNQYARRIS